MIYPGASRVTNSVSDMRIFPARYATAFLISGDVFKINGLALQRCRVSESLLIGLETAMSTGRKQAFFQKNPVQRERTTEGTPHAGGVMFRSGGNMNHQKSAEMTGSSARRVTKGDNIGGDALIDKISDLYLLQTDAAKKTLDYQVAGSKNGAIAVVLSAVTGANGTVTCSVLRSTGGTFGSYKVKDGARIQFINGTTNVARGAPTTGVVVDPGGNNRATSVITFDTVPAGTTVGDYLTYEGSALKAPHGLTDLINNDTGERLSPHSSVMTDSKSGELQGRLNPSGHGNLQPSRGYTFGRFRDYWRGPVPLITRSAPDSFVCNSCSRIDRASASA